MSGNHSEQCGLTLPELLVGLAVVGTLTMGAGHQLTRVIQENRMAAEVNAFVTALHLARNEAVKHAVPVVLCPARDGRNCGSSRDWESGWILFQSDDRERDANEPLLQSSSPMQSGITMRSGNHRKRVVYRQDGSSGGTNSSFTFCDRRGLARPRVICLSNTGRPRLTMTRCDGKPIDCT
ncbi:MAG: GspH/FimT family pseudopilin [Gammaproteobacteria bacterium]|nr:MAG: GspH/FimT family pseudopilin [Gammaproteobacteria bacterium]